MKISRGLLKELVWLLPASLLVVILRFSNAADLDVALHDTYFVLPIWYAALCLSEPVLLIIYLIRQRKLRFRKRLVNVISLILFVMAVFTWVPVVLAFMLATNG